MIVPLVAVLAVLAGAYDYETPGTCTMDVSGVQMFDHTDGAGNPRYNPDHTLYPNDMVSFEFRYFFDEECINPYVGRIRDERGDAVQVAGSWGLQDKHVAPGSSGRVAGEIIVLTGPANACHGAPPEGGGGPDGYSGGFGESRHCGEVSLTISAHTWVCVPDVGCYKVRVRDTARITPEIVAPMVLINTTIHMLLDPHGYPAMNLDRTYYPWDPIAVEHRAVFEHGDERAGTIAFRYDRMHPGLVEEGGLGCDGPCEGQLQVDGEAAGTGFLPYPGTYGNGGGIYAYTAPSEGSLGPRTITYRVSVENMGVPINSNRNETVAMVVRYDPVFGHRPYTVLADGYPRSYDDRQGVAIRYEGSAGSGPGDDGLLHPDRRAKITAFHPVTVARSASTLVEPMVLDPALLSWNSTWAPPHLGGYHQAKQEFAGAVAGAAALPDHPFWSTSGGGCPYDRDGGAGCHLMFLYASHGAVRFAQSISEIILVDNAHRWYDNVTTANRLASDGWAGHPLNTILNYTYTYPHTELANAFRMTSYGDDGLPGIGGGTLSVTAVPHVVTHDRRSDFAIPLGPSTRMGIMLDEYILAKTLHETGDRVMAQMAASETYGMDQSVRGSGEITMRVNKTALEFWTGALRASGYANLMEMALHEALEHEATMNFMLGTGSFSRNLTIPYGYDTTYHERVYTGRDMALEVRRAGPGTAEFAVPYGFGTVAGVFVSGTEVSLRGECHQDPCSVNISLDDDAVTVRNVWGGTAAGIIPPYDGSITPDDPSDHLDQLLAVVPPLVVLALTAVAARGFIRTVRDRR